MSNNSAYRIESHRYSGADEPCGTYHAFLLNVLGVATPSLVPPIEQGEKERYIPGTVYGVQLRAADTPSAFYDLGKSLTPEVIGTKGLAIRGIELARPQYQDAPCVERDDEVAEAMHKLVYSKDDGPVAVTFLDKYALLQGIVELSIEPNPRSYAALVTSALASVVSEIGRSYSAV